MYQYQYPHPALTADTVVFARDPKGLQVLLVERANEPYQGCWAFPGGFMNIDETIEQCALRELEEETGLRLRPQQIRQVGVWSTVDRDPRERVVTVAFCALIDRLDVCGGDDAAEARWFPLDALPTLAFDHADILLAALKQI